MDTPAPVVKAVRINRLLPYWAVFQADVRQTLRSWVYRFWVLLSALVGIGYLLYNVGVYREAGITQNASSLITDLLRWTVLGSVTLIVVLTAGSISSERGTLADSVLSRGISRHQYFLGKWHARLAAVLGTFLVLGALGLTASHFFLHEDLSFTGSLLALATSAALLCIVATCGVTVSALVNNTLLGVAVLWVALYGTGILLAVAPFGLPSPQRALNNYLPNILQGHYDTLRLGRLMGWSLLLSAGVAVVGMVSFSRRDV
jgi:ABC-2 type transport system permease protein